MKKFTGFLDKAKSRFDGNSGSQDQTQQQQQQQQQQQTLQTSIQAPSYADVQRYRYQHGTNIGTLFILERWLCGSMFPDGSEGSSELAAAQAWANQEGLDAAQRRFEEHWRSYVSDADLDWLRDVAKATSIRLPIGYFTLGPPYCQGTPFEGVSQIYTNAWSAVKELVGRCQQRGIGTLIDLHGLPGGANSQEHSGTNSSRTEFWSSKSNRSLATRCLCFIVQQVKDLPGVVGVQVVNESEANVPKMYDWYTEVLTELNKIDPTVPIYVSDGWDIGRAVDWVQSKNQVGKSSNPIIIDTHLYWAFSDADKNKTPQQIIGEVPPSLSILHDKGGSVSDRGAAQVVIGEYSCVLTEDSWAKAGDAAKEQLVRDFGQTQSNTYRQHAGGSFFWTYRMDWMKGGEWGFRQMTEAGAIVPPQSLTLSKDDIQSRAFNAEAQRGNQRGQTCSAHINYWDSNHPGTYEHWRFEKGWDLGFDDALTFFKVRGQQGHDGADFIGAVDLWCLKRINDSGQAGRFLWEFEQGFRQGIRDCQQLLGI